MVRAMVDRPIERATLEQILQAARCAPNAGNRHLHRFVVLQDPLALRVLAKGRRTDELVNRMTGRKVSIRASTETPRQLDGDPIGAGRELHAEVMHGRLLVRVPR